MPLPFIPIIARIGFALARPLITKGISKMLSKGLSKGLMRGLGGMKKAKGLSNTAVKQAMSKQDKRTKKILVKQEKHLKKLDKEQKSQAKQLKEQKKTSKTLIKLSQIKGRKQFTNFSEQVGNKRDASQYIGAMASLVSTLNKNYNKLNPQDSKSLEIIKNNVRALNKNFKVFTQSAFKRQDNTIKRNPINQRVTSGGGGEGIDYAKLAKYMGGTAKKKAGGWRGLIMLLLGTALAPFLFKAAKWVVSVLPKVMDFFKKVKDVISPYIDKFIETAKKLWNSFYEGVKKFWEWIKPTLEKVWNTLKDFWENTLKPFWEDKLKPFFEDVIEKAWKAIKSFWEDTLVPLWEGTIKPFFGKVWEIWQEHIYPVIVETIIPLWKAWMCFLVEDVFKPLWDFGKKVLVEGFKFLFNTIISTWETLQPFFDWVVKGTKWIYNKLLVEFNVIGKIGFLEYIKNAVKPFNDENDRLREEAKAEINGLINKNKEKNQEDLDKLKKDQDTKLDEVKKSLFERYLEWYKGGLEKIGKIYEGVYKGAKAVVKGLWNGTKWVYDKLNPPKEVKDIQKQAELDGIAKAKEAEKDKEVNKVISDAHKTNKSKPHNEKKKLLEKYLSYGEARCQSLNDVNEKIKFDVRTSVYLDADVVKSYFHKLLKEILNEGVCFKALDEKNKDYIFEIMTKTGSLTLYADNLLRRTGLEYGLNYILAEARTNALIDIKRLLWAFMFRWIIGGSTFHFLCRYHYKVKETALIKRCLDSDNPEADLVKLEETFKIFMKDPFKGYKTPTNKEMKEQRKIFAYMMAIEGGLDKTLATKFANDYEYQIGDTYNDYQKAVKMASKKYERMNKGALSTSASVSRVNGNGGSSSSSNSGGVDMPSSGGGGQFSTFGASSNIDMEALMANHGEAIKAFISAFCTLSGMSESEAMDLFKNGFAPLIQHESGFKLDAVNPSGGATGWFQIMPFNQESMRYKSQFAESRNKLGISGSDMDFRDPRVQAMWAYDMYKSTENLDKSLGGKLKTRLNWGRFAMVNFLGPKGARLVVEASDDQNAVQVLNQHQGNYGNKVMAQNAPMFPDGASTTIGNFIKHFMVTRLKYSSDGTISNGDIPNGWDGGASNTSEGIGGGQSANNLKLLSYGDTPISQTAEKIIQAAEANVNHTNQYQHYCARATSSHINRVAGRGYYMNNFKTGAKVYGGSYVSYGDAWTYNPTSVLGIKLVQNATEVLPGDIVTMTYRGKNGKTSGHAQVFTGKKGYPWISDTRQSKVDGMLKRGGNSIKVWRSEGGAGGSSSSANSGSSQEEGRGAPVSAYTSNAPSMPNLNTLVSPHPSTPKSMIAQELSNQNIIVNNINRSQIQRQSNDYDYNGTLMGSFNMI